MDSLNLNKHISGQFNAELESIRTQVMTMGGMVEQQLSDAITAMHNQDSDLAKRVIEGDKERIQIFEGVCMQRKGVGMSATFTVRKIASGGIGVERIYPLHSPRIAKIERLRRGKVRRANISYLRGLTGRAARIQERR